MNRLLILHSDAAKNALSRLWQSVFSTVFIVVMLAIAMSLPLALYLGIQSTQSVLGKLHESPQIMLYMELSADGMDNDAVRASLEKNPLIDKHEFVSKQKGLEELQHNMGEQDLVSILDSNPLPDAFVLTPKADLSPEATAKLQTELAQLPMVESVSGDAEWVNTLYHMNRFVRYLLWFLASTLSMAFVLVVHNTIRLQVLSHREEIEITKLLGAPASFIRRPFLYQAIWQSVLATGLSLGLCAWLVHISYPALNQIFQPYGLTIQWRFFAVWEGLAVLLLTSLLGISGAWLAVQQHLSSFQSSKS